MANMQAPPAADNVDPVYEWLDDGASYLLRLNLPGFKKEDFRVHVDGEGRLTVIGHRKPTPGGSGKALRLHKTFQLPNTANLETITGHFDSNVLTLTVPKLPAGAATLAPPPPPPQAKEEARVGGDKPAHLEDKAAKVGQEWIEVERTSLTARSKEEDEKAKPTAPPPPPPSEKARGDHEQQDHQDDKTRAMASMQAPAAADNVDPVYEWLDDGASYLLRLNLPGFEKEDFRIHVDGKGRLTVIGHRKPTPGGSGKALRLHKMFQLPNTANLDTITGRFDSNVLTLTVPKLPAGAAALAPPPPPPPPPQAKEESRVGGDKPAHQEDKAAKVGQEWIEVERTSLTARSKEGDEEAKPTTPPPPPPSEKARGDHEQQDHQDDKARADHREKVAREAARRIEAARARVAEAKAKAEWERQCEHWKERAMEERMKLAEAVSKKKEVIATAVAAFTLGVFVSSRLFPRN